MAENAYKVELETYNGPLDLLLYLIRREEVDIYDIPIARLTAQYLQYVELLTRLDPDHVAEFLVMAATLMEIKSRLLLPKPPPEEDGEDAFEDPRLELVHRLLEYKRYKDAAQQLGTAADERAARFGRLPVLPQMGEPAVDLDNVQVWDLLSAFSKLIAQIGKTSRGHQVVYDDTPISLHATDIVDWLERSNGSGRFDRLFEARQKSEIIGLFLALLELIRAKRVRAEQEGSFDVIVLHLIDATPLMESEIDDHLRSLPPAGADEATATAHEKAASAEPAALPAPAGDVTEWAEIHSTHETAHDPEDAGGAGDATAVQAPASMHPHGTAQQTAGEQPGTGESPADRHEAIEPTDEHRDVDEHDGGVEHFGMSESCDEPGRPPHAVNRENFEVHEAGERCEPSSEAVERCEPPSEAGECCEPSSEAGERCEPPSEAGERCDLSSEAGDWQTADPPTPDPRHRPTG